MVSHEYKKGDYLRHSYPEKERKCLYMCVLQLLDRDNLYKVRIVKDQDKICIYEKGSIHKFGLGSGSLNSIKVMSEKEVLLELL